MTAYIDRLRAVAQGSQELLDQLTTSSIKLEPTDDPNKFKGRWGETVLFRTPEYDEELRSTIRQAFLAIGARQVELFKAEIRRLMQVPPDSALPSVVTDLLEQIPEKFVEDLTRLMWGDLSENLPTEEEWNAAHPNYETEGFSYDGIHCAGLITIVYTGKEQGVLAGIDIMLNAFKWKKEGEADNLAMDVLTEHLLRI